MTSKEVDFKVVDLILATGTLPKEARSNPVFHDCIHELSALPIYRLSSEPSYLRDCHKRIVEENHKIAYDNYSTFIQTAECTKLIFKDFEDVEKKNELLSARIPNFVDSCNTLVEKIRKSISIANMNSLTLKNHNQILEILEIPQLLEACIRNNYIDEALEVIAHTRRLERRHQNIDIIKDVAKESRLAAQKLLDQLFQQLGGILQLPACLKIVGYLRRMDCLPDSLLRLKFLQCRDNYLKNLLHSVPSNDSFFHATKYMEITRVNLFDMATQYRAVFNDEDVYVSHSETDGCHQGTLFASWLVMRVHAFMTNLSGDLDSIVQNSIDYNHLDDVMHRTKTSSSQSLGSKLQSLLGQAMYFGLSLSRIGCDFRPLLIPVFYEAVMKYVELRLDEIPVSFASCITSYKWTVNLDPNEQYSLTKAIETTNQLLDGPHYEDVGAPSILMNHPLLAVLVNQLVSVLEDIRLCCPRPLRQRIWQAFSLAIDRVGLSLLKYYQENHQQQYDKPVTNSSLAANRQQLQFEAMIGMFLCQLVPHVNFCLVALFRDSYVDSNENVSSPSDTLHEEILGNGHRQRYQIAIDVGKLADGLRTILPESFFEVIVGDIVVDGNEDEVQGSDHNYSDGVDHLGTQACVDDRMNENVDEIEIENNASDDSHHGDACGDSQDNDNEQDGNDGNSHHGNNDTIIGPMTVPVDNTLVTSEHEHTSLVNTDSCELFVANSVNYKIVSDAAATKDNVSNENVISD